MKRKSYNLHFNGGCFVRSGAVSMVYRYRQKCQVGLTECLGKLSNLVRKHKRDLAFYGSIPLAPTLPLVVLF